MAIQAVVFDIGNVLIEWNPERYYDAAIGEDRRRAMFAEVDLHGYNDRVDRGEDFRGVIEEAAGSYPAWREEILHWHGHWLKMATPEIPQSVAILRRLRGNGVPVFALSNFGIGTFELAEPVYPFLAEFDRRYISGYMGVTKPGARIYEMVEEDCGLPPESLLFADDRADNIAAAAARGWQTHLFTTPEAWEACLISHGVLTAREPA
ncbi:HAD family hydrolase [Salipiger sp.]|uniref:HAD family hydrolase n=1 Tax=Salipiger sp. TaxID=2078585 RepID=UPI003A97B8D5